MTDQMIFICSDLTVGIGNELFQALKMKALSWKVSKLRGLWAQMALAHLQDGVE